MKVPELSQANCDGRYNSVMNGKSLIFSSINFFIMKVLWGALMVDGRNKIGGHVASKNRSGAYMRTKVTPVNGQTPAQQLIRGRFGAASQAWRGLTEAQRQSWINAAADFPVFDIFGSTKILSGSQLYNRLNLNLAQAGQSAIATAPTPVALASLVSLAITAAVGAQTITIAGGIATVPAGTTLVVFTTPMYGPGKSFVKNKFRFIGTISATDPFDGAVVPTDFGSLQGPITLGNKVSMRCFLVSNTTGQAGVPFSAEVIATA